MLFSKISNNYYRCTLHHIINSMHTQVYQRYLDLVVPYPIPRWISCLSLLLVYFVRVFYLQGWYIVTYALAIYILNLFIAFLTPKFDPGVAEEEDIGKLVE